MRFTRCEWVGLCQALLLGLAVPALAADSARAPKSVDEIALELVNPASSLFSVANDLDYLTFQGRLPTAGDQGRTTWRIEPSFPFVLGNGKNIVIRARFPIIFGEPTYAVDDDDYVDWRIRQNAEVIPDDRTFFKGHGYLGDIGFDVVYGGVRDSGLVTTFGLAGGLTNNEDGSTERDQYLLGPDIAVGKFNSWGVIGVRATHLTDIANQPGREINYKTNETSINVFFAYRLSNGWQAVSNPTLLYDWEGAADNKLLLPLGGGASKTLRVGGVPLKMALELYHYVESTDAFGADWLATFSITPVVWDRSRD